jgi:NitT/TauT family transport system permease protein
MRPPPAWRGRALAIVVALLLLALWELLPGIGAVDPFFTSSPSRIAKAAEWLFAHGFWNDIRVSLAEYFWGMLLAIVVGVLLGWGIGWNRTLGAILEPYVTVLNAAPRVALFPLLILWLGIGMESKIAAVFLGGIFPIIFTVMKGVRTIDAGLLQLARSFGANGGQIFVTLAMPASVPFIVAGLEIAVGRGLVGVVIGELLAAQAGVGFMMARASATFQTDKVFVGLMLLTGFGFVVTELIKMFERRFEAWRS